MKTIYCGVETVRCDLFRDVCACVCAAVSLCVRMHMCPCVHGRVFLCVCVHTCVCTHTCVCAHARTCVCSLALPPTNSSSSSVADRRRRHWQARTFSREHTDAQLWCWALSHAEALDFWERSLRFPGGCSPSALSYALPMWGHFFKKTERRGPPSSSRLCWRLKTQHKNVL